MNKILQNAKAVCSLLTAVVLQVETQYGPDGTLGKVCAGIVLVGGVFATWRIPNADTPVVANEQSEF